MTIMSICMAFVISRSHTIFVYLTVLITTLITVKVEAKKFNNKTDTFISLVCTCYLFIFAIASRISLFKKENGLCIFVWKHLIWCRGNACNWVMTTVFPYLAICSLYMIGSMASPLIQEKKMYALKSEQTNK